MGAVLFYSVRPTFMVGLSLFTPMNFAVDSRPSI